jgi:hypothetical protein
MPFQDLPESAKIRFLAQNSLTLLKQLNVAEKQIAELVEQNKKQERHISQLEHSLQKNQKDHSEAAVFDIFRNELIEELRKLSVKIADQEKIAMYSEMADMITRLKKSGKKMRKTLL